jgi:hypothetical protein
MIRSVGASLAHSPKNSFEFGGIVNKQRNFWIVFSFLLGMMPPPAHAHPYQCADVPQLEQILQSLTSSCGTPLLCKSMGYAGGSVRDAINACVSSGTYRPDCMRNVSCEGNPGSWTICRSLGYVGDSVASAIEACKSSGTYAPDCMRNVGCAGRKVTICRSQGYVGDSVASAIEACKSSGTYAPDCMRNVTCE